MLDKAVQGARSMIEPKGFKAIAAFIPAAAVLLFAQTALWALLFRPWADPIGFGLLCTLATLPLSGPVAVFGAMWASRRIYRAERAATNSN